MRVELLPAASEARWRHLLEVCPDAVFTQTPEWARVAAAFAPGWRPAAAAFVIDGAREYLLPLTAIPKAGGLLRSLHSQSLGRFGGFLYETPPSMAELQAMIRRLLTGRTPVLTLVERPEPRLRHPGAGHPTETILLDLDGGPGAVVDRFEAETRRAAARAERRGVSIRWAETPADWRELGRLHALTMDRRASALALPAPFLEAVAAAASEHCRLWLADYEGRAIACALVLTWKSFALWYLAGFDHAARTLNPNNLLLREILTDAAARGVRRFDFGASPGMPGVEKFKAGFGGRTAVYRTCRYAHPLYGALSGTFSGAFSKAPSQRGRSAEADGGELDGELDRGPGGESGGKAAP